MKKILILIYISAPVLFCALVTLLFMHVCSQGKASPVKTEQAAQPRAVKPHTGVQPFRLPVIPDGLISPVQRANYLALHYWDHYDFSDTTHISRPGETEQILSDYIHILPHTDGQTAQESVARLVSYTEKRPNMFLFITDLLDKYLYDPNSPYRNEEYYLGALQYIDASPELDKIQKSRFAYQLQSVLKNRKGTRATDFTYTLAGGKRGRMYNLKSAYVLLYFNNPGCRACEEVQAALEASMVVSSAVRYGLLKILAVYPDEDLKEWEANRNRMPAGWINGYDAGQSIKEKELYNLRAIPSLYLLDKDKTVLVKDGTVEQVEALLEREYEYERK